MRALEPEVVDAVWEVVEALLPPPLIDEHPLGCHRPRVPDRVCFAGIVRHEAPFNRAEMNGLRRRAVAAAR